MVSGSMFCVSGFLAAVLSVFPALAQPTTRIRPTATPSKINVTEKSLGALTGYDAVRNISMSLEGNHVAFLAIQDKQQRVVLDGKPGPTFEWVIPESIDFSPGGTHLTYIIQTASETVAVIDHTQARKGFYAIEGNHVSWSPDGKRTAYIVQIQGGGAAIVIDGIMGPKFDAAGTPFFSPDSQHLAYLAARGKQRLVVLDGVEHKPFDAVGKLTFSPNSKHLTYEAVLNGKALLVMDGQEGKPYDSILLGPGFSNDGARLVAVVALDKKLIVVVNGRESTPYEALVAGDFVLSPDGKHIGYAIKQGKQQFVLLDDIPQPNFDHLAANALSFSPDSKRTAYVGGASKSGPEFVVLDGIRQKDCDGVLAGTPQFSPDSKHLAYGAKHGGKWSMRVDEVEGKPYDIIEPPLSQIFSPDSQHVAYRAKKGDKQVIVRDGFESPAVDLVSQYLTFSPNSKHLAYLHAREGQTYLVVDGAEVAGPFNPLSPDMRLIFDDNTTAHFIATRKDEFVRVEVKM